MKILLFGEYSGLFNSLKAGLIALGHDVFMASNGDSFKNFPSDYRWDSKLKIAKNEKIKNIIGITNFYRNKKLFIGHDVVLIISPYQFSQYAFPNRLIYNFLINNNKKVFLSGAGITANLFDYWYERKEEKYYKYMVGYLEKSKDPKDCRYYKNKSMLNWEKELFNKIDGYIPIWYEYAQPFREVPNISKSVCIPINLNDFEYKPNIVKDKIVFFHGLSKPSKGGEYIIGAFDKLREKYKNEAEFICKGNLPIDEYLNLLDRTNVILDDANSYSLGMNALFSMAKGKIVMGGAEPIANKELNYSYNPAYNLFPNIDQISDCIEDVIKRKAEIENMGLLSRKFVEEHHDCTEVARKYIQIWENN